MTTLKTIPHRSQPAPWQNPATILETEVFSTKTPASIPDPLAAALAQLYGAVTPIATSPETKSSEEPASNCVPTAATDHRRFPRRTAGGFVSIARHPADNREATPEWTDWLMQTTGLTGELVDLSRNGLALLLLQPLSAGDLVVARLSQQDTAETLDVVAEVVRVIDLGDQRWKIMTQFQTPLEFDEAYDFARHDQDAVPPLFT